jgi:hypothetical protein
MLGVILSLITSDMIYKHILRSTFSFKIQFYYIYYNPENLLKIVNVVLMVNSVIYTCTYYTHSVLVQYFVSGQACCVDQ